jgi:hypothetical protein
MCIIAPNIPLWWNNMVIHKPIIGPFATFPHGMLACHVRQYGGGGGPWPQLASTHILVPIYIHTYKPHTAQHRSLPQN